MFAPFLCVEENKKNGVFGRHVRCKINDYPKAQDKI